MCMANKFYFVFSTPTFYYSNIDYIYSYFTHRLLRYSYGLVEETLGQKSFIASLFA